MGFRSKGWIFLNMSQTAVLSIMYISAIGFGLAWGGIYINTIQDDDNPDKDVDTGLKLIFAGGLITTLFWVLSHFRLSIRCKIISIR